MQNRSRGNIRRPVAGVPRAGVPARPAAGVVNRAVNINRMQSQVIRQQAVRQIANQNVDRPRPIVRPAAPPQRVMPKQPLRQQAPKPIAGPIRPAGVPVRPGAPAVRPVAAPVRTPPRTMTPPSPAARMVRTTAAVAGVAAGAAVVRAVLNCSAAHPQIAADVSSLQSSLNDLQNRSSFSEIMSDASNLDTSLSHMMDLLEGARKGGYVFQPDLDETAYDLMDRWQSVRDQAINQAQAQARVYQGRLVTLDGPINQLNRNIGNPTTAVPLIGTARTQVTTLLNNVNQAHYTIENTYSEIESKTQVITSRLSHIHWALKQLEEAKFTLAQGEDLYMAVACRWDLEGNDDPEGILYLTTKRLLFERKEKVATKKVLFVAVAKELVQEVMIDQPLQNLKSVKAQSKGLFGHQDFIEVEFAEKKLGTVSLHINGQDSKLWTEWIEKARASKLENERVSGSGLSYADLTGPLTTGDIMAAQNEVAQLMDEVALKTVHSELANLENEMRSLERKLAGLRARGYVIEKSLEADITILASQWERVKGNAEKTIEGQSHLLNDQMTNVNASLAKLVGMSGNLASARPQFMQLKSEVASLEASADAAEAAVVGQFDAYADEVETLAAHLDWVDWMLDALETSSFRLLATESGVAAVEAVYARPGMEAENGILFLTDQRLLWEDRVGEFELKIDVPLQQVEDVQKNVDEADGQEFLDVRFGSGAPYPSARFDLSMPVAEDWIKMVGRARSGGYAQDRAVEISQVELDRIKNAPQQCSNCGAVFTAPVLRGQTEINCEYCGVVTHL
jgi:hypothetical protein